MFRHNNLWGLVMYTFLVIGMYSSGVLLDAAIMLEAIVSILKGSLYLNCSSVSSFKNSKAFISDLSFHSVS